MIAIFMKSLYQLLIIQDIKNRQNYLMKETFKRHNRTTSDIGPRILLNKALRRQRDNVNPFPYLSPSRIHDIKGSNLRNYLHANNEKKLIKLATENKQLRIQNASLSNANNQFLNENVNLRQKLMDYKSEIHNLKLQFQSDQWKLSDSRSSNQNSIHSFLPFESSQKLSDTKNEEELTKSSKTIKQSSFQTNDTTCCCERVTQQNVLLQKKVSNSQTMILKLNAELQKSFVKLDMLNRKISQRDKKIAIITARKQTTKMPVLQLSSDDDNQQ